MANLNSTLINGNLRVTGDSNLQNLNIEDITAYHINITSGGNITLPDQDSKIYFGDDAFLCVDEGYENRLMLNSKDRSFAINDDGGIGWIHVKFSGDSWPNNSERVVASEDFVNTKISEVNSKILNKPIHFPGFDWWEPSRTYYTRITNQYISKYFNGMYGYGTLLNIYTDPGILQLYYPDGGNCFAIRNYFNYNVGDDDSDYSVLASTSYHVFGDETWTTEQINAKCANYLPLSGGTITGNTTINRGINLYFGNYSGICESNGSFHFWADEAGKYWFSTASRTFYLILNTTPTTCYTPQTSGTLATIEDIKKDSNQKYTMTFSNDTLTITENY